MTDAPTEAGRDYRATVFLPRAGFPVRGDLPKKEPQILARWDAENRWRKLRAASTGRPLCILHDGPPYANGNIPGRDCQGLPIEWQIEERYRKQGRNKDAVPVLDLRAGCLAWAEYDEDADHSRGRGGKAGAGGSSRAAGIHFVYFECLK